MAKPRSPNGDGDGAKPKTEAFANGRHAWKKGDPRASEAGRMGTFILSAEGRIFATLLAPSDRDDPGFVKYRRSGASIRRKLCAEFAFISGGKIGTLAMVAVASAAAEIAAANYLFDKAAETGDEDLFIKSSKIRAGVRQGLALAWDLASKTGEVYKAGAANGTLDAAIRKAEEEGAKKRAQLKGKPIETTGEVVD